jgi:DNA-binding protein H-NS
MGKASKEAVCLTSLLPSGGAGATSSKFCPKQSANFHMLSKTQQSFRWQNRKQQGLISKLTCCNVKENSRSGKKSREDEKKKVNGKHKTWPGK